MCTVSVIPIPGGFRLVTNRDESPDRAAALPPEWHEPSLGGPRTIWPVDPEGGGTWVAAGEHGLALALLNGNPREPVPAPHAGRRLSRGSIIPALIGEGSAPAATAALEGLELDRFAPFRVVAVDLGDGPRVFEARWDGRGLDRMERGAGPVAFASSGLGDWLVEARLPLFASMLRDLGATPRAQDAFHAHRWPDRPQFSVMMERPGARTVSVTRAEVRAGAGGFEISMAYEPVGAPGPPRGS